ncbi:MAG: AAA family ATPase, partial [Planctomycetes bacterium]|nr:AAA family ATPase [Planctomycetota bacterium]
MRITRLEIHGFKSFARPETFEFYGQGFTAIVGPNGCGKSNVIDAIRWALGERSRKDLRMKESTDVIFGGTTSRPAAKYASVTITFENADKQVANVGAEFSITRKLSAGGDSTYQINGEECKLRDIEEILKGTGIGPEGYSVMGQGKIDALLVSNPAERRKVFEEAAGISNYRDQKASSERKLEVVAQNLAILTEKINDAKSRLRSIKGAASRAFKYKEYTERLRVLRTQLALKQFHRFSKERDQLLESINDVGKKEGQLNKQLVTATMESESLAKKLSQGEAKVEELRNAYHQCEMQLGQGEARRVEAKAKIEGLMRASERAEADIVRLSEQIEALEKRREELDKTSAGSRKELEKLSGVLAGLVKEEETLLKEGRTLETGIRALREEHVEHLHGKNAILNEKLRIEAESKAGAQRRLRLERRRAELNSELEALGGGEAEARKQFEKDEKNWKTVQGELKSAEGEVGQFNTKLSDLRNKRHKLELQLSACQARISHLEDIETMIEGIEKGSRELVNNKKLCERFGVQGLVAGILSVDLGVAPALESALGKLANAIVVDTSENAFDAFDYLAKRDGAASTIVIAEHFTKAPASHRFPSGTGILGPLLDEVKAPEQYSALAATLLGDWLLVADRDVARRVLKKAPTGVKLVTPTGEVFHSGTVA